MQKRVYRYVEVCFGNNANCIYFLKVIIFTLHAFQYTNDINITINTYDKIIIIIINYCSKKPHN